MKMNRILIPTLTLLITLGSLAASAQTQVMYQQRFFEAFGDGAQGPGATPCCVAHPVTTTGGGTTIVPGTFDTRTTGAAMGPYFDEYVGRTQTWYGTVNTAGDVTLQQGAFTTSGTLMLISPGGGLLKLSTSIMRTVQDLVFAHGNGPGAFTYNATSNNPTNTPTFRSSATFTPPSNSGKLTVTPGPNQYGGTKSIIHEQLTTGFVNDPTPGLLDEFFFPVAVGPGVPFTANNIVRRETRSAPFNVRVGSFSGPIVFSAEGTGWFTILPYTTGMVTASANTIGTSTMAFTTRIDTGFNNLNATSMGGVTGQLQLVSAHLLNTRGATVENLAGSNLTRITFMPEPGSAALIGAGVFGLIGMAASDRRRRS